MKPKIHPQYHHDAQVTCTCGNTFATGSTKKTIQVGICNMCHPFFTGEMKFVDTMGRVEKFQAKQKQATKFQQAKKAKKVVIKKKIRPATLKEMMLKEKKRLQQKKKSSPKKQ